MSHKCKECDHTFLYIFIVILIWMVGENMEKLNQIIEKEHPPLEKHAE